jgi:uncharacterized coiled-coil protein SlyX
VVVAQELDETGQIVRTWYVLKNPLQDGRGLSGNPEHRLVSRDIKPSTPTPDYDRSTPVTLSHEVPDAVLERIRRERNDMLAGRERHVLYSQQVLDDRAKLVEQQSRIEQLESTTRDQASTINALNDALSASAEQLRQARKQKSLLYRLRLLCR